jgi:hypothetical protein
MSQSNQLVSKAIELQQNTLANSQQAMEQAVELPLQQSVALQRNAAQFMLDGLEIGNWFGTQSVELTRDALDSYIQTVENAAQDASELTEWGMENAEAAGERDLQSTQQFATGIAGDGQTATAGARSQSDRPPAQGSPSASRQGPPQQSPRQAQQPPMQAQQVPQQTPLPQMGVRQAQPQGMSPTQAPISRPPPQQTSAQQPQPQQTQARQPRPQEMPAQRGPVPGMGAQQAPPQQAIRQEPQIGAQAGRPVAPATSPSQTEQASAGSQKIARQSSQPMSDSQQPPRQAAVVGESERETETPADNA